MVTEGESLLSQGQVGEASLRFSRVLLDDPGHDAARVGEARARALLQEQQRLAELHLDEAQKALGRGQVEEAQVSLAEAVERGADPSHVQALADRLDEREGRVDVGAWTGRAPSSGSPVGTRPRRLPRVALALGFLLPLALLLAGVTVTWGRILDRLTTAPRPLAAPAAPAARAPLTAAESALLEARELLAAGKAGQALLALDKIPESDPHWPFAQRLRAEAGRPRAHEGIQP